MAFLKYYWRRTPIELHGLSTNVILWIREPNLLSAAIFFDGIQPKLLQKEKNLK